MKLEKAECLIEEATEWMTAELKQEIGIQN